jgi:hypothetical protein
MTPMFIVPPADVVPLEDELHAIVPAVDMSITAGTIRSLRSTTVGTLSAWLNTNNHYWL